MKDMPILRDSYSFKVDKSYKDKISSSIKEMKDSQGAPALEIVIDATHGGYINNNFVLYTSDGQQKSAQSFFSPFPKPVLIEHDDEKPPIGRVTEAEFISLEGGTAVDAITKLEVPKPTSKIRLKAVITDIDAMQKIADGRFLTVSISGRPSGSPKCGVCKKAIDGFMGCEEGHVRGKISDGKIGHYIIDGMTYSEVSFVNKPADQSERHAASLVSLAVVNAPAMSDDAKAALADAIKQAKKEDKERDLVGATKVKDTATAEKTPAKTAEVKKDPPKKEEPKPSEDGADCPECQDGFWTDVEKKEISEFGDGYEEWNLGDARLTTAARKKLSGSQFCGPDRSFPVPDCSHAANAKARATQGRNKGTLSSSSASKIIACANRKAKSFGCGVEDKKGTEEQNFESVEQQQDRLEDFVTSSDGGHRHRATVDPDTKNGTTDWVLGHIHEIVNGKMSPAKSVKRDAKTGEVVVEETPHTHTTGKKIPRLDESLKGAQLAIDAEQEAIKKLQEDLEKANDSVEIEKAKAQDQHKKDLSEAAKITEQVKKKSAENVVNFRIILGKDGIMSVFSGDTQNDRMKSYNNKVSETLNNKSVEELAKMEDELFQDLTKAILARANNGAMIGAEDDPKLVKKVKNHVDRKNTLKGWINGD